jgi:hypothetical protein
MLALVPDNHCLRDESGARLSDSLFNGDRGNVLAACKIGRGAAFKRWVDNCSLKLRHQDLQSTVCTPHLR